MSEWKEHKLDDVALINPPESIPKGKLAKKVMMDVLQPFTKKINKFSVEPFNGGMKFRNGDTIVARITPCLENGKTAFIDFLDEDEIGFGSTEYIVLRERENISDEHFLYYFSISPEFREVAILSMTGSSGRQRVQTDVVREHTFFLPPLPEQKAIAGVLSSLDDKIDLLHRQNKTLEALAETLFRQWFVEPARAGEPHAGGEARDDWEEYGLYEAIELVGGGTPKTSTPEYWNGEIGWLSGGDIATNHKGIIVSTEKSITTYGLHNSSAKLLPRFSTVMSARGTVGKYCILSKPMAFSQSNYGIKPKFTNCYFFTYLMIAHCVEELQSAAYGSVFDTITTNTFKGHTVVLPSDDFIKDFESEVSPIFMKMLNNDDLVKSRHYFKVLKNS